LLLLIWSIAVAALAVLAVAVVQYLGGSTHLAMQMTGTTGGETAHALARAGSDPAGPLLSTAVFTKWQLNTLAVAVLVVLGAWYLTAAALVPARNPGTRWPRSHAAMFFAGLAVCAYATNGAVAVYDQVLFSAHMVGHLMLVMAGPALLMAGRPLGLALAASTAPRRERLQRVLRGRVISVLISPPVALVSYTVVIVGSHLTGLMAVIMRNSAVGEIEHLVYVGVGCQFFVLVVGTQPIRWKLSSPVRWLLLAVAMAVDTFTGIVLMESTTAMQMAHSAEVHVDALSDTHTGGAIMWVGGDLVMAVVMIQLVGSWMRRVDTASADEKGWLEQARRATFSAHTGDEATTAETFDEDDAARASYNAWLAKLNDRG
jgi:putative copper resistance protein D